MMRSASLFLFLLFPLLLQAADPTPFADLSRGPSAPREFKYAVFQNKISRLKGGERNILERSYYYDYISRRYLIQPGLSPSAINALDRILSDKQDREGILKGIWNGFIRINSGVQKKVAILLQRVVRELPLRSLAISPAGRAVWFYSGATGGLRVFIRGKVQFAESEISCKEPVSAAVIPLMAGGFLGAVLDRGQQSLCLRFFDKTGRGGVVSEIPFVTGSRLSAVGLTDKRVLLAWQKGDSVFGGYYDGGSGKFRRFRPLSGYTLPDRQSGHDALVVMKGSTLYRLGWDGSRGVERPVKSGVLPERRAVSVYSAKGNEYLVYSGSPAVYSRRVGDITFRKLFHPEKKAGIVYCGGGFFLLRQQGGWILTDGSKRKPIPQLPVNTGKVAAAFHAGVLEIFHQKSADGGNVVRTRIRLSTAVADRTTVFGSSSLLLAGILFFISFAYGFIHSSGPGHGKALVMAYFVERPHHGWLPPIKLALIVSITHTGSAFLLATLFQLILAVTPDHLAIRKWFTIFSAAVVILLGLYMLVDRFRKHGASREEREAASGKSMFALGIAAGIVPCPLAMGIMVISIMHGVFHLGMLSVLGMSAGMFLLLLLVGGLTSRSRNRLERILEGRGRLTDILSKIAGVVSSLIIVLLGVALLAPVL